MGSDSKSVDPKGEKAYLKSILCILKYLKYIKIPKILQNSSKWIKTYVQILCNALKYFKIP